MTEGRAALQALIGQWIARVDDLKDMLNGGEFQGIAYSLQEFRAELEAALIAESPRLPLSFRTVIEASVSRARRGHPGGLSDWSALEWAGAMAGEAGEACNAAKKLRRIEQSIANINHEAGRSLTDREAACQQIGKEVADTILYAVLLAARVEVDLEAVLVRVFNAKSDEYGFPERLTLDPGKEPTQGRALPAPPPVEKSTEPETKL
jgi:NTP pyrophosphatase (non-canonical NTP hydrolase)